ncbi:helix-turn-helix domain-containing protein [Opitutus terrae]|uniref:helix-turn-helix domain-containing protein n=1 Tax=Opitutus terrae TaxID=107709 RepID=UPI0002F8583D|nr:XRE family transcriptional regulator [Opitutus terrae]
MNTPEHSSQIIAKKILTERHRQKLSLGDLAVRSDVSKGMLSQIEQGKRNPTIAVMSKIATGLRVPLARLLPDDGPRVWRVIRANDENHILFDNDEHQLRTLSPIDLEKQVEFYELILHPHGKLVSDPHARGAEEILTVAKGHVQVKSGEKETELRRGDSAYYAADVPHAIVNLGNTEAVAYMIVRWYH